MLYPLHLLMLHQTQHTMQTKPKIAKIAG